MREQGSWRPSQVKQGRVYQWCVNYWPASAPKAGPQDYVVGVGTQQTAVVCPAVSRSCRWSLADPNSR